MPHEWFDCLRRGCYISDDIIKKRPLAVWPQLAKAERSDGSHIWQLYVEWSVDRRGHVNQARVCAMHHQVLLELVATEALLEVKEQEVTEQWLIRCRNKMLTPS